MALSSTSAGAGNTLAVRHGAKSETIVTFNLPAAVEEVRAGLADHLTYCEPPDALLIEQLARLLVRIRLVDAYYDRLGGSMVDSQGRPRRSWQLYLALVREFRAMAAALGIGPAARALLLGDLASARRDGAARRAQEELKRLYAPKKDS